MIPSTVIIKVHHTASINDILTILDKEYLEREGFTDKEIENKIEETIRDRIWEYVPENKISIEFN